MVILQTISWLFLQSTIKLVQGKLLEIPIIKLKEMKNKVVPVTFQYIIFEYDAI